MGEKNSLKELKESPNCLICGSKTHTLKDEQMKVTYSVCNACEFVYKNTEYHLNNDGEHDEYKMHNNSFESKGYVQMFERFIAENIRPLNISGIALEFGSGPGPVLKELLRREGFEMYDYDPFFNPNTDYSDRKYDLITSTEVVEHFSNPLKEFVHISSLLKVNSYLVVMTNFNNFTENEFLKWWYRRDATHISFYNVKTFEFIAKKLKLKLVKHNDKNVIIFQKKKEQ